MRERSLTPRAVTDLGLAWASSSTNVSSFRCDAMLTVGDRQVGAFYGPAGQVIVFRRGPSEETSIVEIAPAKPDELPWDAHRSISVGVDSRQRIHLAYDAHASAITQLKGQPDLDLAQFVPAQPDLNRTIDTITYPMFVTLREPSRLAMLFREGVPDAGALRARLFDETQETWIDLHQPLLDGRAHRNATGPYLNRPLATPDGSLLAFAVWRLRLPGTPSEHVINAGLDLVAFRDGLESVETLSGIALPRPAGPMHTERVAAVPLGSELMNQAGAALDSMGNPAAVTWWRDPASGVPQFYLVRQHAGRWHAVQATQFTTDFSLTGMGTLPLPHSRPQLLFTPAGRAVVIFRSAEFGGRLMAHLFDFSSGAMTLVERITLWDADLGHYEPVIDFGAWDNRNRLSMYIQFCDQPQGDTAGQTTQSAPCHIVEWDEIGA